MGRAPKKHGLVTEAAPAKRARRTSAADTIQLPVRAAPKELKELKELKDKEKRRATLNSPPTALLDAFVFGDGEAGELGLGPSITSTNRPRLNPFLSATSSTAKTTTTTTTPFETVQVACGGMHSVVLTRDNKIVTWGVNDHGALGRDTAWDGGLKEVKDGGGSDSDSDSDSALNPLESTPTAIPAEAFPDGTRFVQVAAGDSCSFALTDTGLVYGWGAFRTPDGKKFFLFEDGAEAAGQVDGCQLTPVRIPGLQGITQLAVGANHALALEGRAKRQDGKWMPGGQALATWTPQPKTTVWAWGCGDQHQLGRRLLARHCPRDKQGSTLLAARGPQPVAFGHARARPAGDSIALVASGEYHAFAVAASGRVWAWGLNSFGETGAAPDELRRHGADAAPTVAVPTEVAALGGEGVFALAGGGHHSVALTASGRCLAWGRVDSGQLGIDLAAAQAEDERGRRGAADGDGYAQRLVTDARGRPRACVVPTDVCLDQSTTAPGQARTVAVACGTEHTLVLTAAGSHAAFGAGFNGQGQLGLGPDADEEVALATRLGGKALQDRSLVWAGAGGQFSMVAGVRLASKKK